MSIVKLRFNLRALILVVSLLSLALAIVSQVGLRVANFELLENNLALCGRSALGFNVGQSFGPIYLWLSCAEPIEVWSIEDIDGFGH